jgi:glycosyltransferase involved in cell wall biosynthesis
VNTRLAIVVSHPIQHFAPWHRELARDPTVDLKVFFCCHWGIQRYYDAEFGSSLQWDIPLVEGYEHEFLPIDREPEKLTFSTVDNPTVSNALSAFDPHVIKLFGYAYRTNWRAATWARSRRRPLLIYSDSNLRARRPLLRRLMRAPAVRAFYRMVDGAMFVGDNNRAYHARYGIPADRLFEGMLPVDRDRLLASVPERVSTRHAIREQYGIPRDAFVVLFSGKFSARKRPMDLVRAVDKVRARDRVWVVLMGEGSERAALEQEIASRRLSNVTITGFVNQSAVGAHYAASDALAMISEDDPHPLSVTEASCFGLPIIASDTLGCVGPNDTARPGVNSLVVPMGDIDAIARAIDTLSNERPTWESLHVGSLQIGASQDVKVAATSLAHAAHTLHRLGPRK